MNFSNINFVFKIKEATLFLCMLGALFLAWFGLVLLRFFFVFLLLKRDSKMERSQ